MAARRLQFRFLCWSRASSRLAGTAFVFTQGQYHLAELPLTLEVLVEQLTSFSLKSLEN